MSHSNVGFCDHSNKEWPVRRRPRRRYNWPRDERPDSTLRRSAVKGRDVGDRSLYCISAPVMPLAFGEERSEEHTSELQSLMRISYAVFSLKKKTTRTNTTKK